MSKQDQPEAICPGLKRIKGCLEVSSLESWIDSEASAYQRLCVELVNRLIEESVLHKEITRNEKGHELSFEIVALELGRKEKEE